MHCFVSDVALHLLLTMGRARIGGIWSNNCYLLGGSVNDRGLVQKAGRELSQAIPCQEGLMPVK